MPAILNSVTPDATLSLDTLNHESSDVKIWELEFWLQHQFFLHFSSLRNSVDGEDCKGVQIAHLSLESSCKRML